MSITTAHASAASLAAEPVPQPPSGRLLAKTVWSAIAGGTTLVVLLISTIVVARLLGPEGAGRVAYYNWLVVFLATLGNLGLPTTLARYLSEAGGAKDSAAATALNRGIIAVFVPFTLLGAALIVLGRQLMEPQSHPAFSLLLAIYFLAICGNGYFVNYLGGRQNFRGYAVLALSNGVLQLLFIVLGTRWYGIAGAVAGYMMGNAASLVMTFWLLRYLGVPARLEPELKQRVRRYALHSWLAAIPALFIWARIEVFFLEQLRDERAVAMFSYALTMVMLATQGPYMLTGALMPHLSEKVGEADLESIRRIYAGATRLLSLLVFPICFILAAVTPVLVPLMYGKEFAPVVPNAVVLLLFAGFVTAASAGVSLVQAMERSRFLFLRELFGAVAAIGAFTVAIWLWGDWGAAWARSLLQLALVAISTWYIARRLRISTPVGAVGKIVVASSVAGGAAYLLVRLVPGPAALAPAVLVGALVYAIAVTCVRALHREDVQSLKGGLRLLPSSMRAATNWLLDHVPTSR